MIEAQSAPAVEYTDCNECLRYDIKQSDNEAPVMLELRGMQSTLSLPSLLESLWPEVIAPDRVLPMDQNRTA